MRLCIWLVVFTSVFHTILRINIFQRSDLCHGEVAFFICYIKLTFKYYLWCLSGISGYECFERFYLIDKLQKGGISNEIWPKVCDLTQWLFFFELTSRGSIYWWFFCHKYSRLLLWAQSMSYFLWNIILFYALFTRSGKLFFRPNDILLLCELT